VFISLEVKVEALSFAQSLTVRLQKGQDKAVKFWGQAISDWKKLFDSEDDPLKQRLLFKFQEFLCNSGDALLSNAFFMGEEDMYYRIKGGTAGLFLTLHDLCQSIRESMNIDISVPNIVNDEYRSYIIDRIHGSEWHKPQEGDDYYGTLLGEGNVSYQAVLPHQQAEELFAYAYSFSILLK